jgi:rubrerythrin
VSEEAGVGTRLRREDDGFVTFFAAGDPATGEFRCSDCGYGVSIQRVLPVCPMCGGTAWEHAWTAFRLQ